MAGALPPHRAMTHLVGPAERWAQQGHRSGVIWFTGLSGAGKSSLAVGLERRLFDAGMRVFVLDGDNLRHGLNGDLGFSDADRRENIRRVTEVAAAFAEAGCVVITAFISPFRDDRRRAREIIGEGFHEVHIAAPLAVCEARDPKGLYARARKGEIKDFTGISSPYEAPEAPELVIDTDAGDLDECIDQLATYATGAFRLAR
jgi:bifunctional enzyme CysN/CysC